MNYATNYSQQPAISLERDRNREEEDYICKQFTVGVVEGVSSGFFFWTGLDWNQSVLKYKEAFLKRPYVREDPLIFHTHST